jgi:hypothetical protein
MSMNLYGEMEKALPGMKYGIHDEMESIAAGENIYPGDPVFGMVGDDKVCYGARISAVSLTADADLIAGNSVSVTVNGITISGITFEGSSEDTIKKIINQIDQNAEIRNLGIDAFYLEGSPRAILLQGPGVTITASAVVTGGASQAEFASAAYSSMKFMGVAAFEQLSYGKEVGYYPASTSVGVVARGKVFVNVADDAHPDDKKLAYIIMSGSNAGKFTDVATGNYDCGCYFRSDRVTGNLALIEVRGMK